MNSSSSLLAWQSEMETGILRLLPPVGHLVCWIEQGFGPSSHTVEPYRCLIRIVLAYKIYQCVLLTMSHGRYTVSKQRLNALLSPQQGGKAGYYADWLIMVLIAANVVAVALETVDPLYEAYQPFFDWFEILSVTIFSIEYIGRVWACTSRENYQHPVFGRITFAKRPMLIIDLLAILPFFLGPLLPADLRFLRALRLFRFFRLFKLARYSESMLAFSRVFHRKKADLVVAFSMTLILLVVASSMMYFVETAAQPETFGSIPETLWWGVITLTTVGYGDVTPVTPLGRILGGFVAVLGIGLFGLPASILASGFLEERLEEESTSESEPDYCPHCGERLD